MSSSKLFAPIRVGGLDLGHRIVLAPLTRYRANRSHCHGDLAVEYYEQRANTPGTLLITEATFIAPEAGGYRNVPGIWNKEQVEAWKRVSIATIRPTIRSERSHRSQRRSTTNSRTFICSFGQRVDKLCHKS